MKKQLIIVAALLFAIYLGSYLTSNTPIYATSEHEALNLSTQFQSSSGSSQAQPNATFYTAPNGGLYYFRDGAMVGGWFERDGNTYYADPLSKIVQRNKTRFINGVPYHFNADGVRVSGWFSDGASRGFADLTTAVVAHGEVKRVDGILYTFNYGGRLHSGWLFDRNTHKYAYGKSSGEALFAEVRWLNDYNSNAYLPKIFDQNGYLHKGWLVDRHSGLTAFADARGSGKYGEIAWLLDPQSKQVTPFLFSYSGFLHDGWVYDRVAGRLSYGVNGGRAVYGETIRVALLNEEPGLTQRIQTFDYSGHLYNGGWLLDRNTQRYAYADRNGALVSSAKFLPMPYPAWSWQKEAIFAFNDIGFLSQGKTYIAAAKGFVFAEKNGLLRGEGIYWDGGIAFAVKANGYLGLAVRMPFWASSAIHHY